MSNKYVEMGMRSPVNLTWEVTQACNLSCSHCLSSSGDPAKNELSTAEALDLVEQLHTAGTADAMAQLTARPHHAAAVAIMRDARWNVPNAGDSGYPVTAKRLSLSRRARATSA